MTELINPRRISALKSVSRMAAAIVAAVGLLVLVGWTFGIGTLKSVIPGPATMKANSALCFALTGASLWLAGSDILERRKHRISEACAVGVALLGLLTLSEYLFGWDLRIDQVIFKDLQTSAPTS